MPTPNPVGQAIRPLLDSPAPEVRGEAALALAPDKDSRDYPVLLEMVRDRKAAVRHRAILALGVLGHPGTEVVIQRIMKKAPRGTADRLLATVALGMLPDEPRVPALDAFFNRAAAASRRRIRDEFVCLLLGFLRTPHPARATTLRGILRDDTYRNRPELALAIDALSSTPTQEDVEALMALLKSRLLRTRCAVLRALANPAVVCDEDHLRRILHLASAGSSPAVRAAALDFLTAHREPEALDVAGNALRSDAPILAAAAVRTVRTLGGGALRKNLEETILVTTPAARQVAMLRANRGPHEDFFIRACIRLARDSKQPTAVRVEAVYAVAEAGWKELLPTARSLFLLARDEPTARRLGAALALITGSMSRDLIPDKDLHDLDLLPLRLKALLASGHPDALRLFVALIEKPGSTALQLQALRAYRSVRLPFVPDHVRDLVPKAVRKILD